MPCPVLVTSHDVVLRSATTRPVERFQTRIRSQSRAEGEAAKAT